MCEVSLIVSTEAYIIVQPSPKSNSLTLTLMETAEARVESNRASI